MPSSPPVSDTHPRHPSAPRPGAAPHSRPRPGRRTPGARHLRRRVATLALIGAGAVAVLAPPATSAHQTLVHAFITRDGSTVVSGYDGGVTVAHPGG